MNLRGLITLGIKTLLITILLLAGYYFLFLKPSLALPNAFLDTEKALAEHHTNLLQNRIALTELTRLDPLTPDFLDEKSRAITEVEETNKVGIESAENATEIPSINGAPNEYLTFLGNLSETYPELLTKTINILTKQKILITKLHDLDNTLGNIFEYSPANDLGSLNVENPNDREELLTRITAAQGGLKEIVDGLSSVDGGQAEINSLTTKIDEVISLFSVLSNQVKMAEMDNANTTRQEIATAFGELRELALETELSLIRTDDSISLLTDQTNLILEFEFWIQNTQTMLSRMAN